MLQVRNYVSIYKIKEHYVNASLNKKNIRDGRELDLVSIKRQIARRKFRDFLEKEPLLNYILMYRYIFGNNKPQIRMLFKVTVDEIHNQIAEETIYYESKIPKVLLKFK